MPRKPYWFFMVPDFLWYQEWYSFTFFNLWMKVLNNYIFKISTSNAILKFNFIQTSVKQLVNMCSIDGSTFWIDFSPFYHRITFIIVASFKMTCSPINLSYESILLSSGHLVTPLPLVCLYSSGVGAIMLSLDARYTYKGMSVSIWN